MASSRLAAALIGPEASSATEINLNCPNLDPNVDVSRAHMSATKRPLVYYIGDSISANSDQRAIYAEKNWDLRSWRTLNISRGGATILSHRCPNWRSFYYAQQSDARAVVVELGTNDIGKIWDENFSFLFGQKPMPSAARVLWIGGAFQQMDWAANYLKNKCVVWVGMNQSHDNFLDERNVSKVFNDHIKALAKTHSNLHYADYTSLIDHNTTFYNSLYGSGGDTIHPAYAGRWQLGAWVTGRVDQFCI